MLEAVSTWRGLGGLTRRAAASCVGIAELVSCETMRPARRALTGIHRIV